MDDARLLSLGSHMLKHYLDKHHHQGDTPSDMIFRMKILCYKKTAYERQVHESVLIQQNRHHQLLNSRSEFNRCSLPRLTVKLGDKELSELSKVIREEQKKEDDLEKVIRAWKTQSRKRPGNETNCQPVQKRQRIADMDYHNCEGSIEHLFNNNSSSIEDNASRHDYMEELAIEEAIRACNILGGEEIVLDCVTEQMSEQTDQKKKVIEQTCALKQSSQESMQNFR